MRRWLAIIGIVSSPGCKTDDAKPAASVSSRPAGAGSGSVRTPSARVDDVFDLAAVQRLEPTLPSSTPLAPLKLVAEREQARQSWCMTGSDARTLADEVARGLTAAGWNEVAVLGTSERAGASAIQDGVRLSITIGGRDATCAGLVATGLYTTSTVIIPPLEDGERVR
ncbi:MAG: hypothetical protein JWP01_1636 [Myxococcales bacterium]|nr:hypothetical protein [Myxococcales bacterium]